jgi:hypothetical protein
MAITLLRSVGGYLLDAAEDTPTYELCAGLFIFPFIVISSFGLPLFVSTDLPWEAIMYLTYALVCNHLQYYVLYLLLNSSYMG